MLMQETRTIPQQRHANLLSLGFEFSKSFDERWMDNYNIVKSLYEKNIKHPSEKSKNKEQKRSGIWIFTQKRNKRKGKLKSEQIGLLEGFPNWKWDNDLEEKWIENYNIVKLFNEKDGKYPSQYSKDKEEKRSGIWIANQKSNKRKGKLKLEQISLLENLPNWNWKWKSYHKQTRKTGFYLLTKTNI
jgi:hypothetical protein